MKIVVTVRVRNEEKNLERFVQSYYDWVDKIVILSNDDVENIDYILDIENRYHPKVQSFLFTGQEMERGGVTRPAHGEQLNQLINLAEWYDPDWIIHDDCDCFPNKDVKDHGRRILETCERDFIYLTRLYLYKNEGHFPKLSKPFGKWTPGLWAWRAGLGFEFSIADPYVHTFSEPDRERIQKIMPPMCLLHHPWTDDETIQRKRDFYSKWYNVPALHPLMMGGELQELPWWAME